MSREIIILTDKGAVTLHDDDQVDTTLLRLSQQTATLGQLLERWRKTDAPPNSAADYIYAIGRMKDNLSFGSDLGQREESWSLSFEGVEFTQYILLAMAALDQAQAYLRLAQQVEAQQGA